jgi:hypothetical protein
MRTRSLVEEGNKICDRAVTRPVCSAVKRQHVFEVIPDLSIGVDYVMRVGLRLGRVA